MDLLRLPRRRTRPNSVGSSALDQFARPGKENVMSERRSDLKAVPNGADIANKIFDRDYTQVTAKVVDGWSQVNTRLLALAQSSWKRNLEAAETLRQAQSPKDLMDVQLKLARQTYDDYVDEARQLSELVVKLSSDALGSLVAKG
jgi:phasin family protein